MKHNEWHNQVQNNVEIDNYLFKMVDYTNRKNILNHCNIKLDYLICRASWELAQYFGAICLPQLSDLWNFLLSL